MSNEADTCREYVLPKLRSAGWDTQPHSIAEQRTFTDGKISVKRSITQRGTRKRADYLLRYTRDFALAVVEAKASYKTPGSGLGQAKQYAEILNLNFAYSTNGASIVEFDFSKGTERELDEFPSPESLWRRHCEIEEITTDQSQHLLNPYNLKDGIQPRYYQDIAIHRVVQAVIQGQRRILLTMATGTGKTPTAFQICWKLWASRWNRNRDATRRPRVLYLADRNILIDEPKDKYFTPFGDARYKIQDGKVAKGRELYFAIYQAIAEDDRRFGIYKEFSPEFFDLIVIDECHRGSARADSVWREILEYFEPAVQLGMTATPLRDENRDTYRYFGNPIYTYSLRQGINDGFLAPYRVHRVVTNVDATGWRPTQGELDRFGRPIPDEEYETKDFERVIALRSRTKAIAGHITEYLRATDRFAKTIVFCVDQEHAEDMRRELVSYNGDLVQRYPNYVCRVTSDEGSIGLSHLSQFQDVETVTPTIVTTSKLLTTGVDAPTVKTIVIARTVGSIGEFKQIIGRGTRVRDDYGKLYFSIIDYTGSATSHFADPDFDGQPISITETDVDSEGLASRQRIVKERAGDNDDNADNGNGGKDPVPGIGESIEPGGVKANKYYVEGGSVEIAHQVVYELDADGNQLRVIEYTDYTAENVRSLYTSTEDLKNAWSKPQRRNDVIARLQERGIDLDELAAQLGCTDADPFDLLCYLAFNKPILTRKERAARLRNKKSTILEQSSEQARSILEALLDKYTNHGVEELALPEALKLPPICEYGNVSEIMRIFGGPDQLNNAVEMLQNNLYEDVA